MATLTADAIAIDCPDPLVLARFYGEFLGVPWREDYVYPGNGTMNLWFQQVDTYQPPTWPTHERGQQLHLDFAATDQDAAIAWAIALGATLTDRRDGYHYPILLDPVGHPFCLTTPETPGREIEFSTLNFDCSDISELAGFYLEFLGGTLEEFPEWSNLIREGDLTLSFQRAANYQPPTWPTQERGQQMHIDFHTRDRDAHVKRAIELGATFQVKEKGFTVLLDPAGHPFCICDDNE